MNTVEKYRPTMRNEVLHSWAEDAQAELDALRAKCRRYEEDNANMEKALRGILKMRDCDGEDLLDAQLMAAMAVNPEDYDADARAGWGLR